MSHKRFESNDYPLRIGFKMKNTIKGCFRSVCNHPFLVGILCLLIFLYRSSPLIFSLLVSISPVFVSTALLLGTLLSLGQYEREIDDKTTNETVFAKSRDDTIVEQNVRRNEGLSLDDNAPLIEGKNGEICGGNSKLGDIRCKKKGEWNEDRFSENNSSYVSMTEDEKSETGSFDSEMVNVDSLDSPHSPWTRVETRKDKDNDDDEGEDGDDLDSGSNGVESSSSDESMADMMPMLDELHPLLDEEGPQTAILSRNTSVAPSVRSPKSSIASNDSGDETENNEDDKIEEKKPVITWTDEDQRNVMDLGSSEIERNRRLENLIMRRRARNTMSMVPDINLIDFESCDIPTNIAPIATRKNPFDDFYDNCPIPGSAPSILLQRKNPFDIPFDPSEEKSNLLGNGLQEELNTTTSTNMVQSREPVFRRHETFNVGPSIYGLSRHNERQDVLFRPYFVPERVLGRELSDSKLSSVGETESLGSVEDHLEDHKIVKEDNVQEIEAVPKNEAIDEDVEPELIANMNHVTEQIGHGSRSTSSEESLELGQIENRDTEVNDVNIQFWAIENHYQEGTVVEQRHSRSSSSSSLSKVSENEESSISDGRRESVISTLVDEIINKEPVYDSSPPSVKKNLSASSSSSDVYAESSDLSLPPVLVKRTVSFIEPESKRNNHDVNNIKEHEEISSHENVCDIVESSGDKDGGGSEDEKKLLICKKESPILVKGVAVMGKGETVFSPNSDDDFHEANEKLMCTPSAEGSTPMFYDTGMHKPSRFEQHLEEVQLPNTPVGFEDVHNFNRLNIPEIQDLDLDISSNIISPSSPDVISMPSTISLKANSQIDMHTILEVGNETKDIAAELDNVELKHLETTMAEIDISNRESNEMDGPDRETNPEKNEAQPANSDINHDNGSNLEAPKIEKDDVSVKESSKNDINNLAIVESVTGKTINDISDNSKSQGSTSMVLGPTHETPILEVTTMEDNTKRLDLETIPSEGTMPSRKELFDGSTKQSSDADSAKVDAKPDIDSGSVKIEAKPNVDAGLVIVEVKPNINVESVKVEAKPNTDVGSVKVEAKPNTDVESVKVEAKPNTDVGSVKVEADPNINVGPVKVEEEPTIEVDTKLSLTEITEKTDQTIEEHSTTTSDKGKGNTSSSSSSSSSSESSSED